MPLKYPNTETLEAMIIRLVRMTLRPEAQAAFLEHFDASASEIRAFPGCTHLELWQDTRFPNILTTYSHWESPEALERYRRSDLFRETWKEVKPLFAAPPVARSHTVLRSASFPDGTEALD